MAHITSKNQTLRPVQKQIRISTGDPDPGEGDPSKRAFNQYGSGSHKNPGKVALITGATSGIGKSYAKEFARLGYDLIITGRRKEVILQTAKEIRMQYGVSVRVVIADFSIMENVNHVLDIMGKEAGLEVLVNNAGYGTIDLFHQDQVAYQLDMLRVHVTVPVMLIRKALERMMKKRRGIIINVSSLAAFMPTHTNSMYSGSKAFFLRFTESLHMEVRQLGIQLQCLCPGYTKTEFHTRRGLTKRKKRLFFGIMDPDEVVRYSLNSLHRNNVICIPGRMNRIVVYLLPLVPRKIYYFFARKLQQEPVQRTARKSTYLSALKT